MQTFLYRLCGLILPTFILLGGVSRAASQTTLLQEDAILLAARAANESDNLAALLANEPKALLAADPDASRDGDRLILHLRSGTTKVYQDSPECSKPASEAKCQQYKLVVDARSRRTFLVVKAYYEGADYILIDAISGEEVVVRNLPAFSPAGDRVLVLIMNDEQLGSAVQIWHRSESKFTLEWSGSPYVSDGNLTTYRLVQWNSEYNVELQSVTHFVPLNYSTPLKAAETKRFEVRRSAGGWNVVDVP